MSGKVSNQRFENSCLANSPRVYSYFEKGCRKNVHATIPKGNVGYDQYTVPNDCSCRTYFCCFPLALANICPWPLARFFQISLENRADKTTHNTFRDCRVHFFRQPFSKQLYIYTVIRTLFFVLFETTRTGPGRSPRTWSYQTLIRKFQETFCLSEKTFACSKIRLHCTQ